MTRCSKVGLGTGGTVLLSRTAYVAWPMRIRVKLANDRGVSGTIRSRARVRNPV